MEAELRDDLDADFFGGLALESILKNQFRTKFIG
jgi:hypothetical protein